ncbi:TonB-dependent receptor [Idiomarina seosinensis]|uniref:TonB-dependent receptor plug domain-containing protein n=1 Tax=Idiomarina seosinensis TaxID=281739 RepID=UPI00384B4107
MKKLNPITLAIVAGTMATFPAVAQQQNQSAAEVEEVLQVVGSRLSMRTATDGSAPVDIISAEDLAATGITETAKALQYSVPSFNFPSSSITDGTDAVRPASLRGLSPDHTLVLINGKRRHSSALVHLNGTTGRGSSNADLNAIPIAAIKRIEVLRDGAAALYGSDAIAGVINIVLKDNAEGGMSNLQLGQTHKGDGEQWKLSASNGFKVGDDGAFTLSGEVHSKNRTNRAEPDPRQQYPLLPNGELDPREQTFDRNSFHVGDADYENASLFANLEIGVGESASFYAFGGFSDRTSESGAFYRRALQSNTLTEIYPDGFLPILAPDVKDYSGYLGFEWMLDEWTFDLSAGYGFSEFQYNVKNSLNASLGPDLTPTTFEAGTLQNGETNLTFDAQRFIPFANNSDLSIAMGVSYRENSYEVIAGDEASYINGGYQGRPGGSQGFTGFAPESEVDQSRDNIGLYLEAENQLTTDFMWGAAVRHEDYSDFGTNTSWKISGRYDATDQLAVRATANTGFRAPSVQQLYFTNISTLFVDRGNGPEPEQSGTFNNISPVTEALGIGDLQPEESESLSLGVVWNGFEGLTVTVDAFQIEIQDRIILSGDVTPSDSAAVADALADISAENARFFVNAVDTTTRGIDVVVSKQFDLSGYGDLKTQLAYGYNDTDIDAINLPSLLDGLEDVLFDENEQVRMTESVPKHSGSLGLTHQMGKWSTNLQLSYFGTYDIYYSSGTETYGPDWITDLTVGYQWNEAISVKLGAQNLFSQYPDRRSEGNQFNGIFVYPLTNSPIGFNGGYFFTELEYRF